MDYFRAKYFGGQYFASGILAGIVALATDWIQRVRKHRNR